MVQEWVWPFLKIIFQPPLCACGWGAGSSGSFSSCGEEVEAVPFQNWSLFLLHADFLFYFIMMIFNSLSSKGISWLVAQNLKADMKLAQPKNKKKENQKDWNRSWISEDAYAEVPSLAELLWPCSVDDLPFQVWLCPEVLAWQADRYFPAETGKNLVDILPIHTSLGQSLW